MWPLPQTQKDKTQTRPSKHEQHQKDNKRTKRSPAATDHGQPPFPKGEHNSELFFGF